MQKQRNLSACAVRKREEKPSVDAIISLLVQPVSVIWGEQAQYLKFTYN